MWKHIRSAVPSVYRRWANPRRDGRSRDHGAVRPAVTQFFHFLCAYGVAHGSAPEIDPNAWSIVNGKLYLNYSLGVRERWKADIPGFIRRADANWPAVPQR